MYIFLDESGDLGFDFDNKGTPRYFVITLLVCHTKNTVDQLKRAVTRTLKNKINSKNNHSTELKGINTSVSIKRYFYRHMPTSQDWQLYSIVLDKHLLLNQVDFLPSEHRLYNYLAKEILRQVNFNNLKNHLLLVVDKRKGRKGINEFNKYLTNHLEAIIPLNVIFGISHEQSFENPGLQAVDLFCWGIRRSFEYNDNEWFNDFQDRVLLTSIDKITDIKKDGP